MKKYDPLWHDINTLLSQLQSLNVIELVWYHYTKYNNNAPSKLLQLQIEKVQKQLDDAPNYSQEIY